MEHLSIWVPLPDHARWAKASRNAFLLQEPVPFQNPVRSKHTLATRLSLLVGSQSPIMAQTSTNRCPPLSKQGGKPTRCIDVWPTNPLLSQPKLRRGKFQVPQHAQHDFGSWALCPFDACHGGVKGPAGVAPRPFPAFFFGERHHHIPWIVHEISWYLSLLLWKPYWPKYGTLSSPMTIMTHDSSIFQTCWIAHPHVPTAVIVWTLTINQPRNCLE